MAQKTSRVMMDRGWRQSIADDDDEFAAVTAAGWLIEQVSVILRPSIPPRSGRRR